MSKAAFDKKIEAIEALRSAEPLRKALKDRNNFLVSKAAAVAGDLGLQELTPDLVEAFDRFLSNAVKTDPQCWAKNAIVKALKNLGHDDPAVYIRGIRHIQLEPVWGGTSDTAANLRGACALALAGCALDRITILTHLVDLLADPEKPVRIDAARAIDQVSGFESALLLRLKALTGDEESGVTGQCLASLLDMSPVDYIPFAARFLDSKDSDVQLEAIGALGECNHPDAVELLKQTWTNARDPEKRRAILLSLSASRQPAAMEFLVSVVEDARPEEASTALTALGAGRFREDVRARVTRVVERRRELKAVFEKNWPRMDTNEHE
jgi:HEAT repeat protein